MKTFVRTQIDENRSIEEKLVDMLPEKVRQKLQELGEWDRRDVVREYGQLYEANRISELFEGPPNESEIICPVTDERTVDALAEMIARHMVAIANSKQAEIAMRQFETAKAAFRDTAKALEDVSTFDGHWGIDTTHLVFIHSADEDEEEESMHRKGSDSCRDTLKEARINMKKVIVAAMEDTLLANKIAEDPAQPDWVRHVARHFGRRELCPSQLRTTVEEALDEPAMATCLMQQAKEEQFPNWVIQLFKFLAEG